MGLLLRGEDKTKEERELEKVILKEIAEIYYKETEQPACVNRQDMFWEVIAEIVYEACECGNRDYIIDAFEKVMDKLPRGEGIIFQYVGVDNRLYFLCQKCYDYIAVYDYRDFQEYSSIKDRIKSTMFVQCGACGEYIFWGEEK